MAGFDPAFPVCTSFQAEFGQSYFAFSDLQPSTVCNVALEREKMRLHVVFHEHMWMCHWFILLNLHSAAFLKEFLWIVLRGVDCCSVFVVIPSCWMILENHTRFSSILILMPFMTSGNAFFQYPLSSYARTWWVETLQSGTLGSKTPSRFLSKQLTVVLAGYFAVVIFFQEYSCKFVWKKHHWRWVLWASTFIRAKHLP